MAPTSASGPVRTYAPADSHRWPTMRTNGWCGDCAGWVGLPSEDVNRSMCKRATGSMAAASKALPPRWPDLARRFRILPRSHRDAGRLEWRSGTAEGAVWAEARRRRCGIVLQTGALVERLSEHAEQSLQRAQV